ncbi:MAG: hypothetical protein ACI86M_000777 [Saprospiraceae bacterium]|jgi:hypothetical protein
MKKNIAYFLEDPERLSEISLHELNKWVEEMPFSQPLRLLVDMKSEKFVSSVTEDNASYGAYFAEDYEPLTKKTTKDLANLNIKKVKKEDRVMAKEPSSDDNVVDEEREEKILVSEEIKIIEPSIMTHILVDDVSEDILEENLLETNPNMVLMNEVSHNAADEVLEDELENEVLEIVLAEVEEVKSFSELDSLLESNEVGEETEDVVALEEEDTYVGLVDYKAFVVGVSDEKVKEEVTEIEEIDEDKEPASAVEMEEDQEVVLVNIAETSSLDVIKDGPEKSKKKKKSKKKAKGTAKNKKNKKASKNKVKFKEKNKKNNSKAIDSAEGKKVKAESKKKPKKSNSTKNKISSIKKIKGGISKTDSSNKARSIKGKTKKIKRNVKYVVVNEATTNDFKLKDYDGVSKFTNWLLEQKSINGNQKIEKGEIEALAGKKKDKKKKKNKVLKVAQDSVKKSEMILSEPLANIMAAQGHTKKASKMYKQLGLIFPEKSSYFVSKIENLKNK